MSKNHELHGLITDKSKENKVLPLMHSLAGFQNIFEEHYGKFVYLGVEKEQDIIEIYTYTYLLDFDFLPETIKFRIRYRRPNEDTSIYNLKLTDTYQLLDDNQLRHIMRMLLILLTENKAQPLAELKRALLYNQELTYEMMRVRIDEHP